MNYRHWLLTLLLVAGFAGVGAARAAVIAWDARAQMSPIVARDMPLPEFVNALMAPSAQAVVVSPAAQAQVVNGRFTGNAGRAFDSVVRNLSLLPYFDGTTLHVFLSSEVQRRTINLSAGSAERVIGTLNQLRLHDGRHNTFTAVPASGLLQVTGTRPFIDQVQDVVRSVQLTAAATPEQIGVFPLKHAWARDVTLFSAGTQVVVPGVASLLRTLLGKTGVVGVAPTPARASVGKLRGKGLAAGNETDALARSEAASPPLGAEPEASAVSGGAGAVGGPTVTADVRTNTVVVRDTPDRLPQYAELVKALDVEPMLVELEATIVDVNSDRLDELGVNWRIGGDTNEIRFGSGNENDLRLRGPGIADITPTARGLAWSTIRDSGRLIARITALAASGNARVISRAQVATLANLESSISSNETAYVRVGGFQEVDLFPVTATTSVRITPQVFTRGERQLVSMVVSIRDGRFTAAVVDQIPSVKEVAMSTNGLLADNQTFVVGGFRQETTSTKADKVPLLGDLPVLGRLFKTTSDEVRNAERLFLLTPRVLSITALLERPNAEVTSSRSDRSDRRPQEAAVPVAATPRTLPDSECYRPRPDPVLCLLR
jgi:type III secretion protein C